MRWWVVSMLATTATAITSCWIGALPATTTPKDLIGIGSPRDCTVAVSIARNTSAIVVPNQPHSLNWSVSFATASQIPTEATSTLFTCRDDMCSTFDTATSKSSRQPIGPNASSGLVFQGNVVFPSAGTFSFVILIVLPTKTNAIVVDTVVVEPATASPSTTDDAISSTPTLAIALSVLGGVVFVGIVLVFLRWRRHRNLTTSAAMLQGPPPQSPHWDFHAELSKSSGSRFRKTDTNNSSDVSTPFDCTLGLPRPPPPQLMTYPRHLVYLPQSPQSSICTGYDQYSVRSYSVATGSALTARDNGRDTCHWRDSSSTYPASDVNGSRVTMLSNTSMDPEDSMGRRYHYPPH